MARILDNLVVLEKLIARTPFGFITDIDGTISPTIPNILNAQIIDNNRMNLTILQKKIALLAFISGRDAQDVRNRVAIDGAVCIGHYGMEYWQENHAELHPDAQSHVPTMNKLVKELEQLKSFEGVQIQDKGASVSIHYRMSPQPEIAKETIWKLLGKSRYAPKLHVFQEKRSIGILPRVEINKGTPIIDLIKKYNLHSGLFLGDDTADIPAFHAIRKNEQDFHGFAIAVVNEETPPVVITEADFILDGVKETEILLKWLVEKLSD